MLITIDTNNIFHDVLFFAFVYCLYSTLRFLVKVVSSRGTDIWIWLKQRKVSPQFKRRNSQSSKQSLHLNTNLSQSLNDDLSKSGRDNSTFPLIILGNKLISPVSSLDAFTIITNEKKPSLEGNIVNGLESPVKNVKKHRASIRLRAFDYDNNHLTTEKDESPESHYEISYTRPPSKLKLEWVTKPSTVLIIKKWKDPEVTRYLEELAIWLQTEKNMSILVEKDTVEEFTNPEISFKVLDEAANNQIDLIICLGGDGTVLYLSSLFQKAVPPVLAFNLGSFGFLTPFSIKSFKEDVRYVLKGQFYIKLRLRLKCTHIKKGKKEPSSEFQVLNEVVVDRGNSPFLTKLQCSCDDRMITTVQADGIIVATATGSTAYSLSAGGSLIHPMLPAILFTPICPHTLSFRPVVLPASCTLRIQVPEDSHPASASFDGRNRCSLEPGDSLVITISKWPFPTVSRTEQIGEWFQLLANHMNWNKRIQQKVRVPVEAVPIRSSM